MNKELLRINGNFRNIFRKNLNYIDLLFISFSCSSPSCTSQPDYFPQGRSPLPGPGTLCNDVYCLNTVGCLLKLLMCSNHDKQDQCSSSVPVPVADLEADSQVAVTTFSSPGSGQFLNQTTVTVRHLTAASKAKRGFLARLARLEHLLPGAQGPSRLTGRAGPAGPGPTWVRAQLRQHWKSEHGPTGDSVRP
jgi:hypothetical protein